MTQTLDEYIEGGGADRGERVILNHTRRLKRTLRQCVPDNWYRIAGRISYSDRVTTHNIHVMKSGVETQYMGSGEYEDKNKAINSIVNGIEKTLIENEWHGVNIDIEVHTVPQNISVDIEV